MVATKHPRSLAGAGCDGISDGRAALSDVLENRPVLLVSVRDAGEAGEAMEGGARIIDVKEPLAGPLGRASLEAMNAIANLCAHSASRRLLTAALGDLDSNEDIARFYPPAGIGYFKLGLAGWRDIPRWEEALDAWRLGLKNHGAGLIAAAYADPLEAGSPDVDSVLAYCVSRRLSFLLIDTFKKDGSTLTDHASPGEIERWIRVAHSAGVAVALAGSLCLENLDSLALLGADVLAVRGAACKDSRRQSSIDRVRVATLALRLASRKRHPA